MGKLNVVACALLFCVLVLPCFATVIPIDLRTFTAYGDATVSADGSFGEINASAWAPGMMLAGGLRNHSLAVPPNALTIEFDYSFAAFSSPNVRVFLHCLLTDAGGACINLFFDTSISGTQQWDVSWHPFPNNTAMLEFYLSPSIVWRPGDPFTPGSGSATISNLRITTSEPYQADLEVHMAVTDLTPGEGDTMTFTATVVNQGPDNATGIAVADVIPSGVIYVSHVAEQGSYNPATGAWDVGSIANGGSVGLAIDVKIDFGTLGNVITYTASVIAADRMDPDVSNNTVAESITVRGLADFKIVEMRTTPEGQIDLEWYSAAGSNYVVWSSRSIGADTWSLEASVPSQGVTTSWRDTTPPSGGVAPSGTMKFYRIQMVE